MSGALVVLLIAAQPASAACWGGVNEGAWYGQDQVFNAGVRSNEDFEAATPPSGTAIVHPMQVVTIGGDFIGWGTARGEGTNVPGALSNCPDDYSSGWHVYIDGYKFGVYFCRQQYGSVSGNAQDQLFQLRYGTCSGADKWKAGLEGSTITCQIIDDDSAYYLAAGGEVIGTSTNLHIDIHYDDLEWYYPPTSFWYAWTYGDADECVDTGYRIGHIAADDVWTEDVP